MRSTTIGIVVALGLMVGIGTGARSDPAPEEGVYIIFDASGSMWGQLPDGTHKIQAARDVLTQFVEADFAGKELALRAYGHNRKGDCADTELVVPFAPAAEAAARMQRFADTVNPKGKTPISRSLRAALEDFGERRGDIILISDGIETCDEDPCALVRAWMEKDVNVKVYVVGLGLDDTERAAMACISDAAGTEYQDAKSTSELARGLARIHERTAWSALVVRATTAGGEPIRVVGTAALAGGEPVEIRSHRNNAVPAGENRVRVGVETRNGGRYKPVEQTVTVGESGQTVVELVVEEPPSVRAKFIEAGTEVRGSHVTAYEAGAKVFDFRAIDRVYVDPGTYEFRASPNPENELSVTATIADGEHREIVFELVKTVRAVIKLVAAGSGIDFRENYELWQEGKKVEDVHWVNGVQALPGKYRLRLVNPLTPYEHDELVLTGEPRQEFRIEIPVGHVHVVYHTADGARDDDERCWIKRWDGSRWIGHKTQRAGADIPLPPGRYRAEGWKHAGKTYDPVEFSVSVGETLRIVVRSKT